MQALTRLMEIMKLLRDPANGCPWDREQTLASILPYTLEEVYELADAIDRDVTDDLRDELGDLLFHLVFYARMAEEAGRFDFHDVAAAAVDKLERRHPHVFGDAVAGSPREQSAAWERLKAAERGDRSGAGQGVLAGVPAALPAMIRAGKLQKRAAAVGFDWPSPGPVLDKIEEELEEVREVLSGGAPRERLAEELGDLLFAVVNLARHAGVDPESALRAANRKFESRFGRIESDLAARGMTPDEASLEDMEAGWQAAKQERE